MLLLLASFCASCGGPDADSRPELYIAAASDLIRALPELCKDFHAQTGTDCRISFGSSGMLAQQILHGAPFAVFLSADRQYVEQLSRAGKVAGIRRVYARGRLVVWSRDAAVTSLAGLRSPQITRIALANPVHAPYGRAARQALERAGLWTAVQPKLVLADTVRHSLDMAESGNADAALAALSLIAPGAGSYWLVPEDLHDPIEQEGAVLHPVHDAEKFLAYLASPPAQRTLGAFGFGLPK